MSTYFHFDSESGLSKTKILIFLCLRLHGSYEALDNGSLSDALVDLTGKSLRDVHACQCLIIFYFFIFVSIKTNLIHLLKGGVSELISLEDDCGRKLYMDDEKV